MYGKVEKKSVCCTQTVLVSPIVGDRQNANLIIWMLQIQIKKKIFYAKNKHFLIPDNFITIINYFHIGPRQLLSQVLIN